MIKSLYIIPGGIKEMSEFVKALLGCQEASKIPEQSDIGFGNTKERDLSDGVFLIGTLER